MTKEDGFDGKSRRVHERGDDPAIKLKIAGKTYVCINWSLGGFLIEGYDGGLTMGSLMTIEEIGASSAKNLTKTTISARVVRADSGAGHLALNILDIDSAAYGILQEQMAKKMQALKAGKQA
ncbi:MAG: hypothetical protein HOL37_01300 [Rhodospirillaceae bacterium]|jgi:hypothetical protein|nr:hypothetical protein [Rhodospirillaceae bacterium]MBT4219330.1 hypothetical protein [Rhodospirillaceae bacterium]MBT5307948.1 hypothetical protein [Rhodospirillaceae bacterium]MBT7355783.1 hypothetical protein [Rhodospirillaceae bacterium]